MWLFHEEVEINLNIPYTVWEKDGAYLFKTDYGIV